MRHARIYLGGLLFVFAVSVFFSGCATVRGIAEFLKPSVKLNDVRLAGLNFEAADLVLDVEVQNPNPFLLPLTGFDYDLKINEISFLKGEQPKQQQIAALGKGSVEIPVTLNYKNLYETFASLKDQDVTAYKIDCGLSFELPGLVPLRIPLGTQGEIPALKLPEVDVDGLRVKQLGLTGADLELKVHLKNPNAFTLLLNHITYDLTINGNSWMKGDGATQTEVTPKGEAMLRIPIALDFNKIGGTVSQLLAGQRDVSYQFRGKLDLGSSLPLLKQATLPFDRVGKLRISR